MTEGNKDVLLEKMYSYRRRYVEKEIRSTNYFNETGPKVDLEENITSMHYFGSKALEEAFEKVNFTGVGNILDAGSGFGGCARFWAEKLGKTQKVTACEYSPEFIELSEILTKELSKDCQDRIVHVCGDLTTQKFDDEFDGVYSFLVFLHIPKSLLPKLFENLSSQMKSGAIIFIEDFYADDLTENLKSIGKDFIGFDDLPTKTEYETLMKSAGFEIISFEDTADKWETYVKERSEAYTKVYKDKVKFHGEENGPIQFRGFFNAVLNYFQQGGKGARIVANKI